MAADWLVYIGVPLGAALIGYVTNWVAIRMLFRPHTAKRVLGLRVPFTPGVIPARRGEMAERMGAAVARHLITRLDELLDREWGPLEQLVPEELQDEWARAFDALRERLRDVIAQAVRDPQTEELVRERVQAYAEGLWARPLRELLPEPLWRELPERLTDALLQLAHDEAFEARVRTFLDERVDALLRAERPLRAYLPPELREAAYERLGDLLPVLLEKLATVLEDEALKKRLRLQLYELADRLLTATFREDSLWDQVKFTLMETFVISVDELKEAIDRAVEEAAPRLAALLRQPDVRARAHQALVRAVDALLDKTPSDFKLPPEALEGLKARLAQTIVAGARSPDTRRRLVSVIQQGLERVRDRPLRDVLLTLKPEEPERLSALSARLGDEVLRLLRRDETVDALTELLMERLRALVRRPIGRLRDRVPPELVGKAKRWLARQALELLRRETPRMVQAIDVRRVVREQVDKLSIAEVEQLILALTRRQLRAITWFGALLGFLIGLLQVGVLLARGGP